MEVRFVAIFGSVHVSTGPVEAVERAGEKSCEGGRVLMEVLLVAIFGSVHVSTGAVVAARHVQATTSDNYNKQRCMSTASP